MGKKSFGKTLSANDAGATGGHQAGILVPKSEKDLLAFLPTLNSEIKNPDAWIECVDEVGVIRKFRYIYYNNRLHDSNGTRNEYRLTHITAYFREMCAREGDIFEISRDESESKYSIRIVRQRAAPIVSEERVGVRIKISSGWRRIH